MRRTWRTLTALAGELADMCFTDPPYGVNYSAKDKQRSKRRPILNDRPGEQFEAMLRSGMPTSSR